MADEPLQIEADVAEFRALVGRSSRLETDVKRRLRKRLREAGELGAKDARAAARLPGRTRGRARPTGLREGIARGIRVQLAASSGSGRVGVFIRSTGRGLDPGRRALVRRWDRRRGWRHPVFGDRETWVTQLGRPYFGSVISQRRDDITRRVRTVLDEAARNL